MNRRFWFAATLFWGALTGVSGLDFDALNDTIQNEDLVAFQRLLKEPGALTTRSRDGLTPFQVACAGAPVSFVQYLVSLGADVSDFNDFTPLTMNIACREGHLNVVQYLFGRIPNKTLSGTYTHLSWPLNSSTPAKRAVAKFLIENGVARGCPRRRPRIGP